MPRRFVFSLVIPLVLVLTARLFAGDALTVGGGDNRGGVRVVILPTRHSGWSLLEIVDPASGAVLKTLYAGRLASGQRFYVNAEETLPAGSYTVRYRQGIRTTLDGEVKRPARGGTGDRWINPTDVAFSGPWAYVLDSGLDVQETRPGPLAVRAWTPAKGEAITGRFLALEEGVVHVELQAGGAETTVALDQLPAAQRETAARLERGRQERLAERAAKVPYIYKIDHRGNPDDAFADHGRLALAGGYGYYSVRSIAADGDGRLYITSTSHEVLIYDARGVKTSQTIAGWDGNPMGPRCTVWVNSLALGWKNRLYIPNGGYGTGRVYDHTRNGFDGILYSFELPDYEGLSRYVCADRDGSVYLMGRSQQITKYIDDGKAIAAAYRTDPDLKLANPTGPSAVAGLLAVACHGPGFGPYWDSGGGGEVVLLWDDGRSFRMVDRFGTPGVAANRTEFLNPSCAVMTPDHSALWVAEDGLPNTEGPPGNARLRRFLLTAADTQEARLMLPK